MRLLFDASSLLNIIRYAGTETLSILRGGFVLSLTLYEIGNALWKEAALLNRISIEEAIFTLRQVKNLISRFMSIIEPVDTDLVLRLAHQLKITYYDASYVASGYELDAVLVTDDYELKRRIEQNIDKLMEILRKKIMLVSSNEIMKK